jgi:hypothetical protein
MTSCRTPLFHKRWFEPTIIVKQQPFQFPAKHLWGRASALPPGFCPAFPGTAVAGGNWNGYFMTGPYGPEIYRRLQGAVKQKSSTWHMDETFVRIGGWMCLFRAVDSAGQTVAVYLSETRGS